MLDELRVTVIPVGHGDSALISWVPAKQSPFYVLIDGGTKSGGEAVQKYLKDKGINRLDRLVLSHFDSDHVNGLVNLVDDLDIAEYMGPCLPAFERHRWLFGDDIKRGLDTTRILEEKLRKKGVSIRYPLEEYTIRSEDRLFEMRVLSPPRQLLERLLLGNDTIQLFTQYPMPQGWLLDFENPEPLEEGANQANLRRIIRTSMFLEPDQISGITGVPESTDRSGLANEFRREFGIDPEFFGNSVLNDSSIVIFFEAQLAGCVMRRLLFPGDLENWLYLSAKYDRSLTCDLLKASHHGGRMFIENHRNVALKDVYQLIRPRVVTVSATGRYNLPRTEFRNAAITWGSTILCTNRREREVIAGKEPVETSCHDGYNCRYEEKAMTVILTEEGLYADAPACASSPMQGPVPLVTIRQHIVQPSRLLDRFTEGELQVHCNWLKTKLREHHKLRKARGIGQGDDEPIEGKLLRHWARAEGRHRLRPILKPC